MPSDPEPSSRITTNSNSREFNAFTGNGKSDHVTMISSHLPLTLCRFLVKVSRFVFAINTRIILHYFLMLTIYFEET